MLKLCVASIAVYVSYRPLLKTLKYDILGTGANFDEIRVFFREIFFSKNHLNISIFAKIESYISTLFADIRDHESFARNRRFTRTSICDGRERIILP